MKPRLKVSMGQLVEVAQPAPAVRETPIEAARRRHGRPFGESWPRGEGPRFWTVDRLALLKAANDIERRNRSTPRST